MAKPTATKRPQQAPPRPVLPARGCEDCGAARTGEGYAVPAARTDTGKLVRARSGEVWRCGGCSLLAYVEGR